MQTIDASDAKSRFGSLLESVQREPITIKKRGRVVAVMVSVEDYEGMSGRRQRISALLSQAHQEAKDNGLTPDILSELLNGKA